MDNKKSIELNKKIKKINKLKDNYEIEWNIALNKKLELIDNINDMYQKYSRLKYLLKDNIFTIFLGDTFGGCEAEIPTPLCMTNMKTIVKEEALKYADKLYQELSGEIDDILKNESKLYINR